MSNPNEPSGAPKPVVKDKNPHNYRKVGYSMIVISVSLVLIGLLVWAIGDNYHFSGDIMAKQEIDSMTPKGGYAIVVFDYTQPIGAKLKLLDSASNFEDATKLKSQYALNYEGQKGQVLIFDKSIENNTNSMSLAEVYAMTPTSGYDVIYFNTAMPVGARLTLQKLDPSLGAAMNDSTTYSSANVDKLVRTLTLSSSFDDNLKQILGSSYSPTLVSENINQIKLMPPKLIPPPSSAPEMPVNTTKTTPVPQNVTRVAAPVNATKVMATNATKVMATNSTKVTVPVNATAVTHVLNATLYGKLNGTNAENLAIGTNVTLSHPSNGTTSNHTKTVSLSEHVGLKSQ